MQSRNSKSNLLGRVSAFALMAGVLIAGSPVQAQNKRGTSRTAKSTPPTTQAPAPKSAEIPFPKPEVSVMFEPWRSGELPPPLPVPVGNGDEVAAILARKVTAKSNESVPALLTALQMAGFFVTGKDGKVALAPADGKGQGLTVNGWEVASIAKMLGDGRGITLAELDKDLQAVPLLSQLPQKNRNIGVLLLEGVRANAANPSNPYLKSWARFIIELGKSSAKAYDMRAVNDAAEIRLDPIQHLLITRRLYGDLWGHAEKARFQMMRSRYSSPGGAQFVRASFDPGDAANSSPALPPFGIETVNPETAAAAQADEKSFPCRMDGNAPTVMDAGATLSGVGWDKLLGYLEDTYQGTPAEAAVKKFGMYQAAANAILAYAKFVQTYAALETRIVAEDADPLVRTKNAVPGGRKRLKAEVRMNIGNWQMYNCVRMVMNTTTGLDFATVNDGPIGDVGVQWGLTEGGAGDRYSNSTGLNSAGEQIVGFAADAPRRIQDKGVGAGPGTTGARTSNLTFTKTDGQGVAENILEGTPQRNAKIGRVTEVRKQARVVTSIKIKAGEMKGDMVDVAGQAIAGIPGLITMPAELLYRTSWAASGALVVPVVDWEECQGGWSGTISITRRKTDSWKQDGEKKGVRTTTASASTLRTYKYDGTINIKNAVAVSSGGYTATNKTVSALNIALKGESNATSEIVWEDEKTSYYHDSCGQRMTKRTLHTKSRQEQSGIGRGLAEGNLFVDLVSNRYRFNIVIPALAGKDTRTDLREPSGYCSPEHNKAETSTRESSIEIGYMPIEIDDGVLNPKNPNLIDGSRSFTDPSGEEIEIRWSLRNCR